MRSDGQNKEDPFHSFSPIMRILFAILVAIGWMLPVRAGMAQAVTDAARQAFAEGRYGQVRAELDKQIEAEGLSDERILLYVDSYLASGQYQQGLDDIERQAAPSAQDVYWQYARGRLLEAMGRLDEAEEIYREVASENLEIWPNILSLAELLDYRGRRGEAFEAYALFYRPYKNGAFRSADLLGLAGRALSQVNEFRDANEAFTTAYKLDATNPRNLTWWGDLFREKYNNADAIRTLEEALAANPNYADAYVALARTGGGFSNREKYATTALENNPNQVAALSVMAGLHILDSEYEEARQKLETALSINPTSLEALAHLASVHFLTGDSLSFLDVEAQALAINSQGGSFYVDLSKNAELKFRYPDAVRFAEMAVEADRRNIEGFSQLGISLLRLGQPDAARRYLDYSFDQDPFNLFVGNTLTLLDEYANFATLESPHFRLIIHQSERDVLGPAILELAEQAYAELTRKYPYEPQDKILLEAYNDPADFAVRIAGVPHLGLLGVSFGDVLALNTPRAQEEGEYNWARTLWHELTHTISIGLAQNKLPRWFAEGLAVFEEKEARPEWNREMELELLMAYEEDLLLPLSNMDRGFTRPSFQGQILLSYFHSGQIIDYIHDTFGENALAEIMRGYANGLDDAAAIEAATGQNLQAIDRGFRQQLDQRLQTLEPVLAGMPNPFGESEGGGLLDRLGGTSDNALLRLLREGHEARESGNLDDATRLFKEAIDLYPAYTNPGNAYDGLAAIYRSQQDTTQLMAVLEDFLGISEHGQPQAHELGELYLTRDNTEKAIQYLARSLDVNPYEREVHGQLADLYTLMGNHAGATRSYRALLNLDPVDPSSIYLSLAYSLQKDQQEEEALRSVLKALELAPGFIEAQKLLLSLVEQE